MYLTYLFRAKVLMAGSCSPQACQSRGHERILHAPRKSWQEHLISHRRLELGGHLTQKNDGVCSNGILRIALLERFFFGKKRYFSSGGNRKQRFELEK